MRSLRWAVVATVIGLGCGGGTTPSNDVPPDGGPDAGKACRTADDCLALVVAPCAEATCGLDGACRVIPRVAADGSACTPTDRCAVGAGSCSNGDCVPAARKECAARTCLVARGCDPATGECDYDPAADETACDLDGNPCTQDRCKAGTCGEGANTCDCQADGDCPPTEDRCAGRLVCNPQHLCVPDPAAKVTCPPPSDPCSPLACVPATGLCEVAPLDDGVACTPAVRCLKDTACKAGKCEGTPLCDDGNACTTDACDPVTGWCTHGNDDGAPCDDGSACTTGDACAGGECRGATLPCDDGNECTEDSCDPSAGCVFTGKAADAACDDGDPCTTGDACGAEAKCAGTPRVCTDGNPCTDDRCDAGTCVFPANTAACDDGDPCTAGDQCLAGVCRAGAAVFGCCHVDADCDDGDRCAEEACEGHACVRYPEAANACATGGCLTGVCRGDTGACEALDLALPRALVDWDFRAGQPAGFWWTSAGGVIQGGAVRPAGGSEGTAFSLPRKFVPAGVRVATATLATPECGGVELRVGGALPGVAGCAHENGVAVATWAWQGPAEPLDLEVRVNPAAAVARFRLSAWAASGCRPLGPVLAEAGDTLSDLGLAGDGASALVAGRRDSREWSAFYSMAAGITAGAELATADFAPLRFRTSIVRLATSRFLVAYGGADGVVRIALVRPDGVVANSGVLLPTDGVGRPALQPALAAGPDGRAWVAFSSPAGADLDVWLAGGALTDASLAFEPASRVNDAGVGVRRDAQVWMGEAGGVVAWITESGTPKAYNLALRKVTPSGQTAGAQYVTESQYAVMSRLAVCEAAEKIFVAWEQDGKISGRVAAFSDLSKIADLTFPPSWTGKAAYYPTLVSAGASARLLWLGVDTAPRLYAARVAADGTVAEPAPLSFAVEKSVASPVFAPFGPFLEAFAFNHIGVASPEKAPGAWIGLASPACAAGAVDCSDPGHPLVCVGFGATGYIGLPGAQGWCN